MQKITNSLWFHTREGKLEPVIEYYRTLFRTDVIAEEITMLGETPSGHTEICRVSLFGQFYHFMATEIAHHLFNDAHSLSLACQNQEEIDLYWDYFCREGEASYCGWCIDKYGLRWQIIPEQLPELLALPNGYEVMMSQRKIVIKEYYG